jgi:hypothetical protein
LAGYGQGSGKTGAGSMCFKAFRRWKLESCFWKLDGWRAEIGAMHKILTGLQCISRAKIKECFLKKQLLLKNFFDTKRSLCGRILL